MRIAYLSDIHVDFWVTEKNIQKKRLHTEIDTLIKNLNPMPANVFIIAGDLGHYFQQNCEFLKKIREIYEDVILVNGNHDLYLISRSMQEKYSFESLNRVTGIKEFCSKDPGLHYLDGETIKIKGITFGGAGMSWDDSYYQKIKGFKPSKSEIIQEFRDTMNDSRLIFSDGINPRKINIDDYHYNFNSFSTFDPLAFFKKEKKKIENITSADVMITHYSPVVPPSIRKEYKNISSTFFYYNGDDDIQRIDPEFWVFGHTHDYYEFMYRHTKFLCNPLGYPSEAGRGRISYFTID